MIILTLILFTSWYMPSEHDIHVSICDIEIKDEYVEITLKTFIDDLQLAVGLVSGEEVPDNYTSADRMIEEYLQKTILLKWDGNSTIPQLQDISASNDAVWITLSAEHLVEDNSKLTFSNSFLTELYNDQTNIVNIKSNLDQKTYSLNRKKKELIYELDQ